MTLKDRKDKIEFLKQYLPYNIDWYKKLADNQIVAIYHKQVNKNKVLTVSYETDKYTQLSFNFDGTINDNKNVLRKVMTNGKLY